MRKQLKKIAWLFAFGLFMFAVPNFNNTVFAQDEREEEFEAGGGLKNAIYCPSSNTYKCRRQGNYCYAKSC
ncbi:MAG: hypothetical protein HC912_00025 [Saprospiraceae bacterium]|nr:hypothetical protein [Saprospiraceae bacterium]